MILGVTTTTSTLPTVPAGWTQIYRSSPGGNTNPPTGMVCIKQATGSESGTLSVTTAASQSWGQILAFGGVDTSHPQDTLFSFVENNGSPATAVIPAVTILTAGSALVYFGGQNATTGTATPPTITAGTFTETGDQTLGRRSGTMGYLLGHGTGTTGTVTITWSGTARNVGVLVSLRPSTSVVNPGQFFAMM